MKTSKQSGPSAQIVVFLAILSLGCLSALLVLVAAASLKGLLKLPFAPATSTDTAIPRPTLTSTSSPTTQPSFTPLPAQWTETPSPFPGQPTATLTLTLLWPTLLPTVTPVPPSSAPTISPGTLATLTPETDPVLRQIQVQFAVFQAAYTSFTEYHQQFENDSTLKANEKWKTEMAAVLFRLESAASQLAAVRITDPNYAVYAGYLDQISAETNFMVTAYRKGLDRVDPAALQVAAVHFQGLQEALLKAELEYKAVKSRLATPAFSPQPSVTLTPSPWETVLTKAASLTP
jgi:hypothetical protein